MKGKNKGFSLVELIVVIAIMAIGVTVTSYSLTTISLANAKECASEIKASLEAVRMETCRKESGSAPTVKFYRDSDGSVMMQESGSSAKKIGSSTVAVSYKKADGSYEDLGTTALEYSFNRSTGAFTLMPGSEIKVSSGGREYIITCYEKTGKIKME